MIKHNKDFHPHFPLNLSAFWLTLVLSHVAPEWHDMPPTLWGTLGNKLFFERQLSLVISPIYTNQIPGTFKTSLCPGKQEKRCGWTTSVVVCLLKVPVISLFWFSMNWSYSLVLGANIIQLVPKFLFPGYIDNSRVSQPSSKAKGARSRHYSGGQVNTSPEKSLPRDVCHLEVVPRDTNTRSCGSVSEKLPWASDEIWKLRVKNHSYSLSKLKWPDDKLHDCGYRVCFSHHYIPSI